MAEVLLGESLETLIDHRGKTPKKLGGDFTESGVKVISALHVKDGALRLESAKSVSEEMWRKWMPVPTQANDVILTSEAPMGRAALIPDDGAYVLGQRVFGLRGNPGVLDSRFLFYALRSDYVQAQLAERASGTTVLGIRQSELVKVKIPDPGLRQQQVIAGVLGALDDKIAINERIATGADDLSATVYARNLSERPSEFAEHPLTCSAQFINGRAFTKDATGTGRMVVRIAEVNSGPGSSTVYNDLVVPDKHLARPGDILFAWSGSLTVARWYRPESIINQHIFKVLPNEEVPTWLAFRLVRLKLDEFRAIAADKATTMGHIQRRHLDEVVSTPNREMFEKLDAQLQPLWERALAAEQEALALAALRDTLLPQLMSGKLRVRDAERIVEDAV